MHTLKSNYRYKTTQFVLNLCANVEKLSSIVKLVKADSLSVPWNMGNSCFWKASALNFMQDFAPNFMVSI